IHLQNERLMVDAGDWGDVADEIKTELVVEARVDCVCRIDHKKSVTVCLRTHDHLGRSVAGSARPILNHHWLTEPLGEPWTDQACCNVGWTARRISDDQTQGSCRIGLRPGSTSDGRQRGSARG